MRLVHLSPACGTALIVPTGEREAERREVHREVLPVSGNGRPSLQTPLRRFAFEQLAAKLHPRGLKGRPMQETWLTVLEHHVSFGAIMAILAIALKEYKVYGRIKERLNTLWYEHCGEKQILYSPLDI